MILYDAFGIPHESQHTAGEVLRWFDHNDIDYKGAFGPLTIKDNLRALKLMQRGEFGGFKRFFDGYSLASRAVNTLPRLADRFTDDVSEDDLTFNRPPWWSRGIVQLAWFMLGFRFSIFAMAGRKAESSSR